MQERPGTWSPVCSPADESPLHAHCHQDLQGAVQGLHVAMLQGAASAWSQGLAARGPQARHCTLLLTARAKLLPPGAVFGEVEDQELTVLGARGWDQVSTSGTTSLHPGLQPWGTRALKPSQLLPARHLGSNPPCSPLSRLISELPARTQSSATCQVPRIAAQMGFVRQGYSQGPGCSPHPTPREGPMDFARV